MIQHSSITLWKQKQQGSNRIYPTSSFRTIAKVMQLKTLQDYWKYIGSIPGIKDYATFQDSRIYTNDLTVYFRKKTQFLIAETPQESGSKDVTTASQISNKESEDEDDEDTITTVIAQEFVCFGSNEDINSMLELFWPNITALIEQNPNHHHSDQWKHWMDKGLSTFSGLAHIKRIMNLETLAQLFIILRDSPALSDSYDFFGTIKYATKLANSKRIIMTISSSLSFVTRTSKQPIQESNKRKILLFLTSTKMLLTIM